MWHERNRERPNYRRMDYVYAQHHARYKAYVKAHGMTCQACGGRGCLGHDSMEHGPAEPCGWCETTGLVTRWLRGLWLREMQWEARRVRKHRAAMKAAS
jgi:hypothetical protein